MLKVISVVSMAIFFILTGGTLMAWGYHDHLTIAVLGGAGIALYGLFGIEFARRIYDGNRSQR